MNKQAFIEALREKLRGLPKSEVEDRLAFYSEMIDDKTEEGISEEDAVAGLGSPDALATQIISQIPISKIAKETVKPKRLRAREIVLLCLSFPIWLPLLLAGAAILLSLYAVLWTLIISVWAVFAAVGASALGALVSAIIFFLRGVNIYSALFGIAAALACAGASILLFFGSRAATAGGVKLTRAIVLSLKKCLLGKGEAKK